MHKTILFVGILILGMAGLLNAQSSMDLSAEIPFAFNAGEHEMLAGEYTVSANSDQCLMIRNAVGDESAFLLRFRVSAAESGKTARLVFNKYPNGKYFLSQVWHEGDLTGSEAMKTKLEREMVTSTLKAGLRPMRVIIVAHIRK